MDHALATLNSLADTKLADETIKKRDALIRNYISAIHALSESSRKALVSDLCRAFELLDPVQNSIGYLYLIELALSEASPTANIDQQSLLDKILHLLTRFNPLQVRYVGHSFRGLLDRVASGTLFPPVVAVELVALAILRIQPTATMFTSTHLALVKLAVESNILEPALQVLDKEITAFPSMSPCRETRDLRPWCDSSLSPADYISTVTGLTESFKSGAVLEYNFLRSLVYCNRRDWDKAFTALEQAITHPVKDRGVSKVMVDCHKRWILVGLLKCGKMPSFPSYTCGQPKATYNALNTMYKDVAVLFMSIGAAAQLVAQVEMNGATWQEDGTASLVSEVLAAYQPWQIMLLRERFTQIAIGQVRELTCSGQTGQRLKTDEEVIALVQNMMNSGMLKGKLETDDNAVSFVNFDMVPTRLPEKEVTREIAASYVCIKALNQQYRQVNDGLSEKREYAKYMVLEHKRAEKAGSDAGIGLDSQVEDEEDLMTGLMAHG